MSLINGSLQIGRSGILTAQAALTVTGNNMANAANENYSRQRVHTYATQSTQIQLGTYTGTGVAIYDIGREVDEALNDRLRAAVGDSASGLVQQQTMSRIESTFNELTDSDLSSRLNEFFDAWSDLSLDPNNAGARSNVITQATGLSSFIRDLRSDMVIIQNDLDAQIQGTVNQIDTLASQIANLNQQIVTSEAGRTNAASALRDQRDSILRELSELVNIQTQETDNGAMNVYIGNSPLVQNSTARGVEFIETMDANGNVISLPVYADDNQSLDLSSGKLYGQVSSRDELLGDTIADLDRWTASLILEVNKIHSNGQGLEAFTSVTSSFGVADSSAELSDMDESGLAWDVTNGIFKIKVNVGGDTSNTKTFDIKVEVGVDGTDTTLDDLVAALNDTTTGPGNYVTASIDGMGRLQITADSTNTFGFVSPDDLSDASNALAVLGINTFFEGSSAHDISLRSGLSSNLNAIAASSNGLAGNPDVADAIAQLATGGVDSLNGISLADDFNSLIARVASLSRQAQDSYEAADVIMQTLDSERASISGVSLDEEAINMITFQRAFQGAARYVNMINELLDDVIALAN